MVIVDARVIWVMWQVTPQSVVAAQTFQSFERVQRLHPLGAGARRYAGGVRRCPAERVAGCGGSCCIRWR